MIMLKDKSAHINAQTKDNLKYSGVGELWANESCLLRYNKEIVHKLSYKVLPGDKVLEFGAGIGTLAQLWKVEKGIKPVCLEIDPHLQGIIRERGFQCYSDLDQIEEKFDVIYSSNVLEHIHDDESTLRQIYAKLKPNGRLVLYLPAFQCLYSKFDASIGHFRRYDKSEVIEKLGNAGFLVESCEFADFVGFFAWLAMKFKGGDTASQTINIKHLRFYDHYIYPVSSYLDRLGFRRIMGKNLICFGVKAI